ncbi:MAG: hypothetical protein Q9221_002607 [Calogaya cf. arnoldii]
MAERHLPDGKLVYLHCSSIFKGQYALFRQPKKIRQLLEKHQTSIKTLTNEFTIPAITAVAKELLDSQIFESIPRAKVRYPELFQSPSVSQEAKREALEAEDVRTEAEAAHDAVQTSDNEGEENLVEGSQVDEPEAALEAKAIVGNYVPIGAAESGQATPLRPRLNYC